MWAPPAETQVSFVDLNKLKKDGDKAGSTQRNSSLIWHFYIWIKNIQFVPNLYLSAFGPAEQNRCKVEEEAATSS